MKSKKYAFRAGDAAKVLATEEQLLCWGVSEDASRSLPGSIVTVIRDCPKGHDAPIVQKAASQSSWWVPSISLRKTLTKTRRAK